LRKTLVTAVRIEIPGFVTFVSFFLKVFEVSFEDVVLFYAFLFADIVVFGESLDGI
jgi:hypothetical protein